MNLDDVDLEEEWEEFKKIFGHESFAMNYHSYTQGVPIVRIKHKWFDQKKILIFIEMNLIIKSEYSNWWRINPKEFMN